MHKKIILLFIITTSIFSCNKALKDADVIINKSIEVNGGKFVEHSNIEFDFRDKHYKAIRNNGKFQYERIFKDSMDFVKDILPYGLDNRAVKRAFLGTSKLKEKEYYKIKVTFKEDGGGEDFEDVFIYWINTKTFKADYLAYSYNEADGLGLRFREAYNERYIGGIRFVDYNNYKPENENTSLENLDNLYEANALILLSKIELKNILVND